MSKHTPEPWVIGSHPTLGRIYIDEASYSHGSVATCYGGLAEADAARIVACVNACAGMADPAAEISAMRNRLEDLDVRLTAIFMHANELERVTLSADQWNIVCEIIEILKPALTKSGGGGGA